MTIATIQRQGRVAVVCLLLGFASAAAQQNTTILGPSNPNLYHGANELLDGNAEEGVRLTLLGIQAVSSSRDRLTGMSNLCAGFIMLGQLETALTYCDKVLAENDGHWRAYSNRALAYLKLGQLEQAEQDLQSAEAIAPNARNVKIIRSMLLDETDPVAPHIVIDDRRRPADDDL